MEEKHNKAFVEMRIEFEGDALSHFSPCLKTELSLEDIFFWDRLKLALVFSG